jgi:hypothetical protein
MQENALHERLKERLDGERDVRIIALGVSRACALPAAARRTVVSAAGHATSHLRTHSTCLGDGKKRH